MKPARVALLLLGAFSLTANAAPRATETAEGRSSAATNLRARAGTELASRLLHGNDSEERIRGIERAASIGTPEAIALLVESTEHNRAIRADARALLAMARALARFAEQEAVRTSLLAIVAAPNPSTVGRTPTARASTTDTQEEGDPVARAELAREVAAIAVARSGGERALEALYGYARGSGVGQSAALAALHAFPPRDPGFFGTSASSLPVPVVRFLGELGDLRALDVIHAATRSPDVTVRSAALVALAELGDERAVPLAKIAITDGDARLRAAAAEVFVLLTAPERFKSTLGLIADDATTAIGLRMAERVFSPEITKVVAARAWTHPDREIRAAAVRALGRSPDADAAKALASPQLLGDDVLAYHALEALARSPAPNAGAVLGGLLASPVRLLAARAYVVRALVRRERSSAADEAAFGLANARQPEIRAVGVFARVALGEEGAESFLDDRDPRVRRAAAAASLARPTKATERAILARIAREPDPLTRQVFAVGLMGGDPDGIVKTTTLVDRAEAGGGDAPLAAWALARRADESTLRKVTGLLASRDPVLRAHTARGLALSSLPEASGRLAEAYRNETDAGVRRAIVAALAARQEDAASPSRRQTLELAASLDPDGPTRQGARRALEGANATFGPPANQEALWVMLTRKDVTAPQRTFAGYVVRSDGIAVPLAFDGDGHGLAIALPPGEARLVLAPALPTYKEIAP
jgi:HEAT repeat protein